MTTETNRRKTLIRRIALMLLMIVGAAFLTVHWGPWPSPINDPPLDRPDLMVVLGGGYDLGRAQIALRAIEKCRPHRVLVTGDGGRILQVLADTQNDVGIVHHEPNAMSTLENARLTEPFLRRWNVRRLVIVTNWFHAYRAKRVFESIYGDCIEISLHTDAWPTQLSDEQQALLRRERYAITFYLLRHGISPW